MADFSTVAGNIQDYLFKKKLKWKLMSMLKGHPKPTETLNGQRWNNLFRK